MRMEIGYDADYEYQYYGDQEDERQASEDGLLRVLLEPDHDPELCEAQPARIPKDHEKVWQELELQGPHHNQFTHVNFLLIKKSIQDGAQWQDETLSVSELKKSQEIDKMLVQVESSK